MATYTFKIQRFNPDKDKRPHYQEYRSNSKPTDRVLDGLNEIKWRQDGTLTYRRSCAHGVCGSDAMRINGRNRLACKVLIKDLPNHITIEPMLGFTIIKDLVVDLEPFFEKYRSIAPYLINDDRPRPTTRALAESRGPRQTTTMAPSASCARRARRRARRSGPTRSLSAPPRSSTPTASSSTVAIRAPRNAWPC